MEIALDSIESDLNDKQAELDSSNFYTYITIGVAVIVAILLAIIIIRNRSEE